MYSLGVHDIDDGGNKWIFAWVQSMFHEWVADTSADQLVYVQYVFLSFPLHLQQGGCAIWF